MKRIFAMDDDTRWIAKFTVAVIVGYVIGVMLLFAAMITFLIVVVVNPR